MVKKVTKNSDPKADRESIVLNENGKRPAEDHNNEGKKRIKVKNLFRQPTVNELNRLQETETLFNSNLFRLQIEEILQEVQIKDKTEKKFQQWFKIFKSYLDDIVEDDTEYDLSEQKFAKKLKVKLPLSKKLSKTKCIFKFHKFTKIDVVGSYAVGCAMNANLCIDVQVTVPAEVFTKNDSINYRYHKKRAAYLAYLASHLTKLDSIEQLNYAWLNGETKPVLDIKPVGKLAKHFTVRLSLVCESEAYKLHRFNPSRNNLRETYLFGDESQENSLDVPTPYYNSTILSDLTAHANKLLLDETLSNAENLQQAIVLLKIWARQRKLRISGHVICLFVAFLVQMKRINNIMSSYQIVRNVWIALKTSEWDTVGITLHNGVDSPPLNDFLKQHRVVFLDTSGYYNLCWDVTIGTYNALRRESVLAVEMLDNTSINSFIPLFMVPLKPLMQFDYILRFKNMPKLREAIVSRAPKECRLNYGVDHLALVADSLHSILARGLGDRTELILEIVQSEHSWSVKKSPEKAKEADGFEEQLSFGFILNPENAFNIVLKGPPANLPEAEQFRCFWGDKSELRRFQDGAITEACVWEGDSCVTRQILDYLLALKYEIPPSELFHIYDQFDSITCRKEYGIQCVESSAEVVRAFDDLRSELRGLTQLPLDISAVYGISPVFSYCAGVAPVRQGAVHKPWRRGDTCLVKHCEQGGAAVPYTPASTAIIELGHSGKWPGDIEAFRCVKAAFHLQLAERLNKQYSLPTHAYHSHVDVLKNGLVFRLEIAHPKEITLLRREKVNGVVKYRDTEESIALQCHAALMPALRGALHGLHQKYSAFGPTVCIMKRWLSAHLLSSPHFPDTLVELICARGFVRGAVGAVGARGVVGAVLGALHTLRDTDWDNELIVLDFNDDMTREEISKLERKFASARDSFPHMSVVTAYDGAAPGVWARGATRPVAARARALAAAGIQYLGTSLYRHMDDNILPMFVPSLSGYDVLIHLHSSLVPHTAERVDRAVLARPLPSPADDILPVVEFNPVERYLDELRSAYGEWALFFHDCYGGDVIAVLWAPGVHEDKELQISNANALHQIEEAGKLKYKVNVAAIVQDFKIMGAGLVKDITVGA